MKKVVFIMLALSIMMSVSCKSTGNVTDETFARIYSRYHGDLILDGAKSYTVKSGDTLVDISRSHYNDPYYYPVIMLASKDVVSDPDKIQPGMVLTIPNLQKNLNNVKARESMKGVVKDCAAIEELRGRNATAQGLKNKAAAL